MARPTRYSESIVEKICSRLASGESLITVCKDSRMPARSTVFGWLMKDEHKGFLDKYLSARAIAGHACADRILELVNDLEDGSVAPPVAREMSANLRWSAERMAPRYYSPRHTIVTKSDNRLTHEQCLAQLK